MCRLYPLGRIYTENNDKTELGYIILNDELGCKIKDTDYIKVSDWLGIDDDRYNDFVIAWHRLKKRIVALIESGQLSANSKEYMDIQMNILRVFFATLYGSDFFKEFNERLEKINRGI